MGSAGKGINLIILENLSTKVTMVVLLWDFGRSVMKSTAMCVHGHCGTGSGLSLPAGNILGILDQAQDEQDETYLCASVLIWGHQNFP